MNRPTPLLRLSPQAAGDLHHQHTKAIAELRATARFNKELNNRLRSMIGPDALRTLRKDVENALLLADLVEENNHGHVLYVVCAKPEASVESTCNQASEENGGDGSQAEQHASMGTSGCSCFERVAARGNAMSRSGTRDKVKNTRVEQLGNRRSNL
ncbi:hypothetical protein WBQ28_16575 [Pseudomonas syringae pv. syringae]|uniref:hypothetical protein n=1 Tax=Pseudomonas syringae TaxID=317 RepID=UPI003AFF8423